MSEKRDRPDPAPPNPLEAVDPDLEQEGEVAEPGSGWADAAGSAAGEKTLEPDDA